jgi:hypothetical protein
MKGLFTTLLFAAGLAAEALAKRVSYDGSKVVRIPVGEDVTPLYDIISKLKLPTWKGVGKDGVPIAGGHVDLVVPANKISRFEALTKNIAVEVMHEDLGAAISAESGEAAQGTLAARGRWNALAA